MVESKKAENLNNARATAWMKSASKIECWSRFMGAWDALVLRSHLLTSPSWSKSLDEDFPSAG